MRLVCASHGQVLTVFEPFGEVMLRLGGAELAHGPGGEGVFWPLGG